MLVESANGLVKVLLAPACPVCRSTLERPFAGPVCQTCLDGIPTLTPPWCVCCSEPLRHAGTSGPFCNRCTARRPSFTYARSVGRYEGSLREIIHAFKYGRCRAIAEPLARALTEAGRDVLAAADAVIPVPIHPLRAVTRGFNQADDLARHLGTPVWNVLRRARRGPPQASLPADSRATNVRGAFAVRPTWRHRGRRRLGLPDLNNSAVVVIDDVMTTGATLDACSQALLEAGARRVSVLTVARSVSSRPVQPRQQPRLSNARRR